MITSMINDVHLGLRGAVLQRNANQSGIMASVCSQMIVQCISTVRVESALHSDLWETHALTNSSVEAQPHVGLRMEMLSQEFAQNT